MSCLTSIRMFVRVCELGGISTAARDQRVSPAVASSRLAELEKRLGLRLFNRTTRSLQPTEHGTVFHERTLAVLEEAESVVAEVARNPRGVIYAGAPLGVGRRLIAPEAPRFRELYPEISLRLRLSDRRLAKPTARLGRDGRPSRAPLGFDEDARNRYAVDDWS